MDVSAHALSIKHQITSRGSLITPELWVLNAEVGSFHSSDTKNLKMVSRFLENLLLPVLSYWQHIKAWDGQWMCGYAEKCGVAGWEWMKIGLCHGTTTTTATATAATTIIL
jgi:hypothetical protein